MSIHINKSLIRQKPNLPDLTIYFLMRMDDGLKVGGWGAWDRVQLINLHFSVNHTVKQNICPIEFIVVWISNALLYIGNGKVVIILLFVI